MNLKKKSWMKFMLDGEAIDQITALDAIHSNAVSVWLRAFALVKNNGGTMELKVLFANLVNKKMSRRCVIDILLATGCFAVDQTLGCVSFTDKAYQCMDVCSGKNAQAKPFAGANLPEQTPPNARTNRDKRDKNKDSSSIDADASARRGAEGGEVNVNDPLSQFASQPWYKVVDEIRHSQLQKESFLMAHPAMANHLKQHWDWFVCQFCMHAVSREFEQKLMTKRDAWSYFANFIEHPQVQKRIGESYQREHGPEAPATPPPPTSVSNPYEDCNPDGHRSYNGGRPLPLDAPKRPSPTAEWDHSAGRWI